MRRTAFVLIGVFMAIVVAGCSQPPGHSDSWLSWKYLPGTGCDGGCTGLFDDNGGPNDVEANNYYCAIDPADCSNGTPSLTLDQWKSENSFPASGNPDARAIYANLGDLRIGRDMNCWKFGASNQNVACYVTNYGPAPYSCVNAVDPNGQPFLSCGNHGWPNLDSALRDATAGNNPFATVAMVYNPGGIGVNGDNIAFYTFGAPDSNGVQSLIPTAGLDEEGAKTVPRMCMACHGGAYDTTAHKVTSTSFLPFDVFNFRFSKSGGFTLNDQQDAFRALNEMVLATNAPQATADYINGTYPGGIHTFGTLAVDGFVPPNWAANTDLYNGVVRQYCRMCHFGQPQPFISNYSDFQSSHDQIQALVCGSHDMPHAEVPFGGLNLNNTHLSSDNDLYKIGFWWDGPAQRDLGTFLHGQGVTNSCLPHD